MYVHPAGPAVVAYQQHPGPDFALHVANQLPVAPVPQELHLLQLPLPAHDYAPTELAFRRLFLPMTLRPGNWDLALPGVESGINELWTNDRSSGFSLPAHVAQLRAFDDVVRSRVLLTPSQVGIPFDSELLADLAWRVLAHVPAPIAAGFAASAAVRVEATGATASTGVARAMGFTGDLGVRITNLVESGEVLYYHDCLRWIVREVAAADATGVWTAKANEPMPSGLDHEAAARIMFPSLLAGSSPTLAEVVRAAWALHQVFTFSPQAHADYTTSHDAALSMITAIVSSQPQWGAWARRMDRWLEIMAVADTDTLLAGVGLLPSVVRSTFSSAVGLDVDEWLALMWLLGMRYLLLTQQNAVRLVHPIRWLLTDGLTPPLDLRFENALRAEAISTVAEFGNAVLADQSTYNGLGSVSTGEGVAARNRPLLEVYPDAVVPLGIHLISERAVSLPRLRVGPRGGGTRRVNSTIGKCYEAHVRDIALRARPRHRVLTGTDIDAVVPAGSSRCDALIADAGAYLLVEAGLQTLPTGIARGTVADIRTKCTAYHEKADQADATRDHLGAIAKHFGLIPPQMVAIVVVTDVPVPLTQALFDELSRQRPRRNPLFLVSADEFEALMASGENWSIPTSVGYWQQRGRAVPMYIHLWEMGKVAPVAGPKPSSDTLAWIARLGTSLVA